MRRFAPTGTSAQDKTQPKHTHSCRTMFYLWLMIMDTRNNHQAEFLSFFSWAIRRFTYYPVGHCQIYHPGSASRYRRMVITTLDTLTAQHARAQCTHATQCCIYGYTVVHICVELLKKKNHKPNRTAYFMELLKDIKYLRRYLYMKRVFVFI